MYGPDISNNQGAVDYTAFFAAKPDFVYAKVSEGTWYRDPYFPGHHDACHAHGVPVGGYHFARSDRGTDPVAEANFFCDKLGKVGPGDLRPALDMEVGSANRAWALAFCAQVEKRTGVKPLLYTYPDFYRRLGGWPAADLWIADLTAPGHSSIPNVLHQYTWKHYTPGVHGETDYNYAAGLTPILAVVKPPLTPVEEKFLFFRWYLGEQEFARYGKHNYAHRPAELRKRIPARWWAALVVFLANRRKHKPAPAPSAKAQTQHTDVRAHE